MNALLPFAISFSFGWLIICALFSREKNFPFFLLAFLSAGLGLGLSAHISFYSFLLFDHLNKTFIINVHLFLLFIFLIINVMNRQFLKKHLLFKIDMAGVKRLLPAVILFIPMMAIWLQAFYYPFGGWDAWSCWNLKAKFLFLGGEEWKNIFDPVLWRASPHYPLLLPLMNVWGWLLTGTPAYTIPLLLAFVFTFLTSGLLFFGLSHFSKTSLALAGSLLLVTLTLFVKLAVSQYSDIVVSYYLLAGVLCLLLARQNNSLPFSVIAGLFLGFLSFAKSEGLVASLLILFLAIPYFCITPILSKSVKKKMLVGLISGFLLAFAPTLLFQWLYAPANQTFINGFASQAHPTNFLRLKIILIFLGFELISDKWHALWILLLGGLALSLCKTEGRKAIGETFFFPAFLIFYGLIAGLYYLTNTYFEITWWLAMTLNRILFTLLPLVIFWIFYLIGKIFAEDKECHPGSGELI